MTSIVQADTFTNAAGSGAPNFSQGLKISGGSTAITQYVEGTWTPAFTTSGFTGGLSGITFSNAVYTRVGRLVHVTVQAAFTTGTGTGNGNQITITGLPLTPSGSVAMAYVDALTTTGNRQVYANSSSQFIFQQVYSSLAASTSYNWLISGTYSV